METKKENAVSKVQDSKGHSIEPRIKTKRGLFQMIIDSFADKWLWKYAPYWEEENAGEYDDGVFDSELPYIVEQRWIKAKEIKMDGWSIEEKRDFPWHGHTFDDFFNLNKKLQSCKKTVCAISCAKDVERFRRRNREVYDAYFLLPICVMKDDDGHVSFLEDGRHRIFAAAYSDGEIPVWILEYKKTKEIGRDFYIKHFLSGSWRFLNEF